MKRKVTEQLIEWKNSKTRKPLILNGARQVGKTFIVRELGKTYKNFIEINFIFYQNHHLNNTYMFLCRLECSEHRKHM